MEINSYQNERIQPTKNFTETIKRNENVEQEIQKRQEKEGKRKARKTKEFTFFGDIIIKHLKRWAFSKK